MGVRFDRAPDGTFYVLGQRGATCPRRSTTAWGSSAPRSSSKVICVPGEFFDVNPGKRRAGRASRFRPYVRFSLRAVDGTDRARR